MGKTMDDMKQNLLLLTISGRDRKTLSKSTPTLQRTRGDKTCVLFTWNFLTSSQDLFIHLHSQAMFQHKKSLKHKLNSSVQNKDFP